NEQCDKNQDFDAPKDSVLNPILLAQESHCRKPKPEESILSTTGELRMPRHNASLIRFGPGIVFFVLVSVLTLIAAFAASAPGESIDQLYEKAKKDGKLTLYAPLSARSMEVILPE